jgi:hypothetical protein
MRREMSHAAVVWPAESTQRGAPKAATTITAAELPRWHYDEVSASYRRGEAAVVTGAVESERTRRPVILGFNGKNS